MLEDFIEDIQEYGLAKTNTNQLSEIQIIEQILKNFHRSAKQLLHRHGESETIKIHDEYDVQDLLHGFLKLHFDDVRAETYIPEYAGSNSRIDFFLNDCGIAIEVKKTSLQLRNKQVGEQLLIDIARYHAFAKIKLLVCFVYDPDGLINNPIGLENDLMKTASDIKIKVIICPKL